MRNAALPILSRKLGFASTRGEGRFLDNFLMTPLNRTFPLTEMNHAPVLITENLYFDVARSLD